MIECHLSNKKEVIKTTTLRVTKKLWLYLVVAALASLPIISVMENPARADFIPPSDSGNPDNDDGKFSSGS